jgi:hypothetical protein
MSTRFSGGERGVAAVRTDSGGARRWAPRSGQWRGGRRRAPIGAADVSGGGRRSIAGHDPPAAAATAGTRRADGH